MKILKSIFSIAIAASVFSGCSSLQNKPVPSMETRVEISSKKVALGEEANKHWAHGDLKTDTIPGISLDKAYAFLEGKTGETVIVGVIDSGIDINHEDLKDQVWVNEDEIPGNGKDDDNNGYIDDVHGWNYLGGDFEAAPEQLEITRIVADLSKVYKGKTLENISEEEKPGFERFLKYKEAYKKSSEPHTRTMVRLAQIDAAYTAVKKLIGKESLSVEDLKSASTDDATLKAQVADLLTLNERGFDEKAFRDYYKSQKVSKHYDLDFDGRAIVGDDPLNIDDRTYGNSNVIGTADSDYHGCHVAGIILATRDNGIGIDGVAHNAKLMALRAVPDGDERDKDIALAIRYAVDNGAKVINMSFGKSFSPHRHWVFDAIKYAEEKDVLLVHAAGNDSKDLDVSDNWPNDSNDKKVEISDNVITIGAMSVNFDENMPATFSNYGALNVDLFAPGVRIYSTMPENEYGYLNGTSMASPEVAGIAALVRSYYPELSASQVKHVLMNSGTEVTLDVKVPGKNETASFSTLSVSGKLANAYNALVLADQMVNGK